MPRITDPNEIRALLETDRGWSVYALGDLSPGFFEQCEWLRAPDGAPALVLLFRGFGIPVLFTLGAPGPVGPLLDEIGDAPELYLIVRPEILPLIKARYQVCPETAMWRMVIEPEQFHPAPGEEAVRLGSADLEALQRLYADGEPAGEALDFFSASMLGQGIFFGIREGDALVSVAGTHLVAPSEGVAAIGKVYTRRDRRGQGLAARVTGAVTAELLRVPVRMVGLNVSQANPAAIRAYEKLGFARYCAFYEGIAIRRGKSPSGH